MKNPAKDFAPIAADYDFFMAHSSEAEHDERDYLAHVQQFSQTERPIRLLDFGCGAGDFTQRFLQNAGWSPQRLTLTLVEPVEAQRRQAANRLQSFAGAPIEQGASLQEIGQGTFDLILSNHVLYYVPDLEATLTGLTSRLAPAGMLLTAIAGRDNGMYRFWEHGFAATGEPIPYWVAEDVEAVLVRHGVPFRKEISRYVLAFPDSRENRLKILRFLCADHLARMPLDELLALFDPFVQQGQMVMPTHSWHFVGLRLRAKPQAGGYV